MVIFNSYVKLPEGMYNSTKSHFWMVTVLIFSSISGRWKNPFKIINGGFHFYGGSLKIDGLFHGQSHLERDDFCGYLFWENLHNFLGFPARHETIHAQQQQP